MMGLPVLIMMLVMMRRSEIPLLHSSGLDIVTTSLLNLVAMLSETIVRAKLAALLVVLLVEVILRALSVTAGMIHMNQGMAMAAMAVLNERTSVLIVMAWISETLVDMALRAVMARMT